MDKTVIELFAGVGGFRIGLNNIKTIKCDGSAIENGPWSFVWSNQWEPSTKSQEAFNCYNIRFPDINNINKDISTINKENIPNHTLLVGGFPCQDYSVARSLSNEKGIEGKKGVLWWEINDILKTKNPPFVLLENVDRLLKSPSKQRGRDFGIILKCFDDNGYIVTWKVINAADYGFPQRRRRLFIFAFKNTTNYAKQLLESKELEESLKQDIFEQTFKSKDYTSKSNDNLNDYENLLEVSNNFKFKFLNTGIMVNGNIFCCSYEPKKKKPITLSDILEKNVDEKYYLSPQQIEKFKYLRGSKKIERTNAQGKKYFYSEGAMSEVDKLDLPARTMLTSEGTVNRSSHIIVDPETNRIRRLTPLECERLNQFPDNWTNTGISDRKRYFLMGNALVCGIIRKLSRPIAEIIDNEK